MLKLISPTQRAEPFDHADWVFEAKFHGFRAAAGTERGWLNSRNGNLLDLPPKDHLFDAGLVTHKTGACCDPE